MTVIEACPEDLREVTDGELLTAVRERGCPDAEGALYTRHVGAAQAQARRFAGAADAEDVVADAFLKVMGLVKRGEGPRVQLAGYWCASVATVAIDLARKRRREIRVADPSLFDHGMDEPDLDAALVSSDVLEALATLPVRWQSVLWWIHVEGRSQAWVGELWGISPNAVGVLAYRARRGLRLAHEAARAEAAVPQTPGQTGIQLEVRSTVTRRAAEPHHGTSAKRSA